MSLLEKLLFPADRVRGRPTGFGSLEEASGDEGTELTLEWRFVRPNFFLQEPLGRPTLFGVGVGDALDGDAGV